MLSGKRVRIPFSSSWTWKLNECHVLECDYSGVGESESFRWCYLLAALKDWQVWMHVLNFLAFFTPRKSWTITVRYLSMLTRKYNNSLWHLSFHDYGYVRVRNVYDKHMYPDEQSSLDSTLKRATHHYSEFRPTFFPVRSDFTVSGPVIT